MTASTADRKSVRAAEKAAALAESDRQAAVKSIMSTASGRAWLWNLLIDCQCFASTFTPEASITAFNEGRRSIGLQILTDAMAACPDQYLTASREANVRSTLSEQRSSPQPNGGDTQSERGGAGDEDSVFHSNDRPDYENDRAIWGYKQDAGDIH